MMRNIFRRVAAGLVLAAVLCVGASCTGTQTGTDRVAAVINVDLTAEEYAFALRKDDTELLNLANAFIRQVSEDGSLETVINHYFGEEEPVEVYPSAPGDRERQLIVVTNAEFEPFEYKSDNAAYMGIDMELAQMLADYLGRELVIRNVDFTYVLDEVMNGDADIAIAALTVTPERSRDVAFTDTYYRASQRLVVRTDNADYDEMSQTADADTICDLVRMQGAVSIGYQAGTTGERYVHGDATIGSEGFPEAKAVAYRTAAEALQDLSDGYIDFVITDSDPARRFTERLE